MLLIVTITFIWAQLVVLLLPRWTGTVIPWLLGALVGRAAQAPVKREPLRHV